jgi:hypothetical protein
MGDPLTASDPIANRRLLNSGQFRSIQLNARMPTALCEEPFRVVHLEYVANSTALVGRVLIVGLRDTITNQ